MSHNEFEIIFDADLYPVRELKAGSLNCLYENGHLRLIKWGQMEILRMIYGAIRDECWETILFTIENEVIEQQENSFRISYTASYHNLTIAYRADFLIEGKEDHTIFFSMKGKALSGFNRNRIGLCVLHPASAYKGSTVTVRTAGGKVDQGLFPDLISPHQLLKDIRQMDWITRNNIKASLFFEGDIFETEDQRNWMDATYKTYSTDLALPIPVWVSQGDTMHQSVTLQIIPPDLAEAQQKSDTSPWKKMPFPKIGYARNEASGHLSDEEIVLLKKLPFDKYRVEIDFRIPDWRETLDVCISEARQLHSRLELVIFFTRSFESEIKELLDQIKGTEGLISGILPLQPDDPVSPGFLLKYCYPLIKKAYPSIQVGYGTDAYFTELNRNRLVDAPFDFVSFSCNPQVHAVDTRTILENPESLPDMLETIRSFTDKPIIISPVTFRMRRKTDITNMQADAADYRQKQWFGAGWTLLCLYFAGGADSILFYQTNGDKGVLDKVNQSPLFKLLAGLKIFQTVWMQLKDEGHRKRIVFENGRQEIIIFTLAAEYDSRYAGNGGPDTD